jgi:phosphopantetheine--protein transferase-like protein
LNYQITHISECERLFGRQNDLSQRQQLTLWAEKLIIRQSGLPLQVAKDLKGKPFFKNNPLLHCSVSHTSYFIATALASTPIGIDIEHLRCDKQEISQRFFTSEENEYLSKLPKEEFDTSFTRLWTLKEAYSKCIGIGISGSFSSQTIDLAALNVKGREQDFVLVSEYDTSRQLFIAICLRKG